ncbi:hypothetical protein ACWZHB_12440 [Nocardia sp. FBN12]|uniref:hypothetical protein n=1 Tax=Nocardia sp. FBN12 TaxID=3419766 RepID=UPI003D03FC12
MSTLLTLGLATVAVGLLPNAAAIGWLAPVLLMLLRILQGFAVDREWAGAALLSAEYAPNRTRKVRHGNLTRSVDRLHAQLPNLPHHQHHPR